MCEFLCVSTLAGDTVLCQLVAWLALAEEGANQVEAMVLTRTLHVAFIHIWNKSRCFTQMDVIGIILVHSDLLSTVVLAVRLAGTTH